MFTLNNSNHIPLVGVGMFQIRPSSPEDNVVHRVLDVALETGYRLIDTASCYRNEKDIGDVLKILYGKHDLSRTNIFITSKLAPKNMGYETAMKICQQSLNDLQTEYIDLYLIHWPGRSKLKLEDEKHAAYRKETWRAFEEMYKQGLVKNIGVSNFTIAHLDELLEYAKILPVVNQVEYHPHLYQKDLLEYCQQKKIFLQAYSSLGTGKLINNKEVENIATRYSCTASQILLKWALQQNVGVLPKSTNPDHLRNNFNLDGFTLLDTDMEKLNSMTTDTRYCWDPTVIR